MWRRPVIIFVNALTHFQRSLGWCPGEELLALTEEWVLANVEAAGGVAALTQQARAPRRAAWVVLTAECRPALAPCTLG